MTTTTDRAAPAWATESYLDHDLLVHRREPAKQPLVCDNRGGTYEAQIVLVREDKLTVDGGSVTVTPGPVNLFLGEFEEMPADQAYVLLNAVAELADALAAGGPR